MVVRRWGLLVIPVALVLVSVLQSVSQDRVNRASAAQASTGTLKISDWQFPDTLNPLLASLSVSRRIIDMMWDPLVRFDEHSNPFPDVAQQVPTDQNGLVTVGNGALSVTIQIKAGLKWSDGQPMTSADVAFGWQVYSNEATGPACSATCSGITSIDTPDAATAVIHFDRVYGNYLLHLPPVLPAHAFASVGDAIQKLTSRAYTYESTSYVTSGPYQVAQFSNDDRIVLVPNPYYSALVGPYLSSVEFTFYSDKNAMIAAGTAQSTDETEDYTPADVSVLSAHTSQFALSIVPSHLYEQVRYNVVPTYNSQPNPLTDAKVRQALNMAVDRHALCLAVYNLDRACTQITQEGPITPASASHVVPQGLAYDPVQAKALLAGSAYTGQTLDFVTSSGSPVRATEANFLSQAWAAIGVHANVQFLPPAQLFSTTGTLANGAFQVAIYGIAEDPYPDSLITQYGSQFAPLGASLPNNANDGRVNDPQIDALLNDAASTVNQAQRQTDFQQFDQRVVDQAYMLALYNDPFIATSDPAFGHFYPSASGSSWNAFEWYDTTVQPTPLPRFITSTPTPLPTSTPTPSPTATPTPEPPSITKVAIDHVAQGKQQETSRLRSGESATFILLYRATTSSQVSPTASLRITQSGKRIGTWKLKAMKSGGQSGFGRTLTMSGALSSGQYVAHFSLRVGATTLTRTRAFQVTRR